MVRSLSANGAVNRRSALALETGAEEVQGRKDFGPVLFEGADFVSEDMQINASQFSSRHDDRDSSYRELRVEMFGCFAHGGSRNERNNYPR